MKVYFTKYKTTCISLEEKLGLKRGDIKEITILPDGSVALDMAIALSPNSKQVIESLLVLTESTQAEFEAKHSPIAERQAEP